MKKVLVAVLMFCALIFAFNSCGGGGNDGSSQGNPTDAVTTTIQTTGGSTINSSSTTTIKFDENLLPMIDDSVKSVVVPIIRSIK